MSDIVISEFMDQKAVNSLAADFDVIYDPGLVDRSSALMAAAASARDSDSESARTGVSATANSSGTRATHDDRRTATSCSGTG